MKTYFKGYAQRWMNLLIAMVCIVTALLLSCMLFRGKLNKISSQLESYDRADYSIIYILNYAAPLDNSFIFPDTDAQVYFDEAKSKRLTVSGIMRNDSTTYNSQDLSFVNELGIDEMAISRNVSEKYNISTGDSLYVEFPYSSELKEYVVTKIVATNYDFTKPNIDNDIGIICLGFDEGYKTNVQSKYIAFSEHSEADVLSGYPQIINSVVNKTENRNFVAAQGNHILLFQVVFMLVAVTLAYIVFYAKSGKMLRRCYLKGMKKSGLILIPFAEKNVFALIPAAITMCMISCWIPINSFVTKMYFVIPLILIGLFCIGTACVGITKTNKKRG